MPESYDDLYKYLRPKEKDFTGLEGRDEEEQAKSLFDIIA